jgi:hypothetical protein
MHTTTDEVFKKHTETLNNLVFKYFDDNGLEYTRVHMQSFYHNGSFLNCQTEWMNAYAAVIKQTEHTEYWFNNSKSLIVLFMHPDEIEKLIKSAFDTMRMKKGELFIKDVSCSVCQTTCSVCQTTDETSHAYYLKIRYAVYLEKTEVKAVVNSSMPMEGRIHEESSTTKTTTTTINPDKFDRINKNLDRFVTFETYAHNRNQPCSVQNPNTYTVKIAQPMNADGSPRATLLAAVHIVDDVEYADDDLIYAPSVMGGPCSKMPRVPQVNIVIKQYIDVSMLSEALRTKINNELGGTKQ